MKRVLIAEGQRLVREGLAKLVTGLPDCKVVGTCATGKELSKNSKNMNQMFW